MRGAISKRVSVAARRTGPQSCRGVGAGGDEGEALFVKAEERKRSGDLRGAFGDLLTAARRGHLLSEIELGNFYAAGMGVSRDLREAALWYRRACRNGASDGALNLAIDKRAEGDVRGAVFWYRRAVAMKNGDAHLALAKMYLSRGRGRSEAVKLLRSALKLSRFDISDADREEAGRLLREVGARLSRTLPAVHRDEPAHPLVAWRCDSC